MNGADRDRDLRITRNLSEWFVSHARDLPWRRKGPDGERDGYRALVAESMLQQTQVSRVVEKFSEFIDRFPTVEKLGSADEESVLAAWSGLGYYRRARYLQGAAKMIGERFEGAVPRTATELRELPGVGRYTAGAIASIVYGEREPIVDGNVARVLVRIEGQRLRHGDRETEGWAWARAEELVQRAETPGIFNEGMMELGATVCTPRSPGCEDCPLIRECRARAEGLQDRLPLPKARGKRRPVYHASVLLSDLRGRLLIQRRPESGLWAGMYQAPTVEREDRAPRPSEIKRSLELTGLRRRGSFVFLTTHREVHFAVYEGAGNEIQFSGMRWADPGEIARLALASPHRRILLGEGSVQSTRNGTRRRGPTGQKRTR